MNVLICDDERQIAEELEKKVRRMLPEAKTELFFSGEALFASKSQPDIVFLDIQMSGMDGMETAKLLREQKKDMILIFVTGIEEYVFQAFDVGAFHYLVKPFSEEKFGEVLKKAVVQWEEIQSRKENKSAKENGNEEIFGAYQDTELTGFGQAKKGYTDETGGALADRMILIQSNGIHRRIFLENIIFAEVFNRIVLIHEADGDTKYYGKLSDLEKISGNSFFRTHRSYLVNLKYVEKYDSTRVFLTKGEALLAKAKYPEFVKAFLRYCKRGY